MVRFLDDAERLDSDAGADSLSATMALLEARLAECDRLARAATAMERVLDLTPALIQKVCKMSCARAMCMVAGGLEVSV